ncbi:MAG TPA: DUF6286 domain-containing protein [Dermatophilaceae bacterium]|nr:DUF6286 domain-containing protein [Dermatophilaceae bacterium]
MSTSAAPQASDRQRVGQPTTAALAPAKTPVGSGRLGTVGLVLALVVTALGVVAVRDALAYAELIGGRPWVGALVRAVDRQRPSGWLVPVGVVLALVGLWLLVTALRPRPRTAVALAAQTGVFVRPKDVARVATDAAEQVDGVLSANVRATRRTVTVAVRTTGNPNTQREVQERVSRRLAGLDTTPTITVRHTGGPR